HGAPHGRRRPRRVARPPRRVARGGALGHPRLLRRGRARDLRAARRAQACARARPPGGVRAHRRPRGRDDRRGSPGGRGTARRRRAQVSARASGRAGARVAGDLRLRHGRRRVVPAPPVGLLQAPPATELRRTREELRDNAETLRRKLQDFEVEGRIVQVSPGPIITSYEFEPAPGIKVSQVVNLADDLGLALKSASVRIVGPIPGRGTVAIEVPNGEAATVYLREIFVSAEFAESKGRLPLALGKDVTGLPVVADLTAMPHLPVAGATGSGKSVGLNAMICSILYKATPADVRFLLIDPKRLELSVYEGIPHLLAPVVTD